jgi:hypothetical protein
MPEAKTWMVRLAPRLTEASLGCIVKPGREKAAAEVPNQMKTVKKRGEIALYLLIHIVFQIMTRLDMRSQGSG